jgi:DNA-binding winged helix-turn-helix (wHTH) protein
MPEASTSRTADTHPSQPQAIGFDGFVIEAERGRLLGRDGSEIPLRPKALELLIALTASEGRPLAKAELLDRIWGDVHVTEDSLFQAVKDARRALDDGKGRLLRYMPRRGYLLDCPFSTARPATAAKPPELSSDRPAAVSDAGRTYIGLRCGGPGGGDIDRAFKIPMAVRARQRICRCHRGAGRRRGHDG